MSRGRNMGDQGLLSIARHGRDLSLNPAVDAGVEDVEREGAAGEDLVVKSFQVEPGPQLLFGAFAQLADLELAELVAACLAGAGDVSVGLGLDGGFVDGMGVAHVLYHLIAAPAHVVNAGVYHQTHSPEQFRAEAAVVGARVLVEADLLAEFLGVEAPALGVRGVPPVLAELGQAGEGLLDGDLEVVAGNALMIGNGLVVDVAAVGGVGDCNGDAAGTLAVGCSALVVGCGRSLEGRDGLDGDGGFGQEVEKLRQVRLHLGDVLAEVLDDGFSGDGLVPGVVFDVVAEAGEIPVAVGLGEGGHLSGDAVDLLEADLVDLGGSEVSGGEAAKGGLVAPLAAAEGVDGKRGAGVGDVVRGDESGELLVGRENLVVDRGGDLVRETILFGVGKVCGEFLERKDEWVGRDDSFGLAGNLFGDEVDGDEVIVDAGAKDFFGLEECLGDLVKARDVVFVMLDGVEWHGKRKVGEVGMDASTATRGAEGHLVLFEVIVFDALLELAEEEIVGDQVLLGEARGIDGFDAGQIGELALVPGSRGGEGVVAEQVVVAVVTDGSREDRIHLEAGLPGVVKDGVL